MKNKAVNAPIKFVEIEKVMINRLILPLSFYRGNSKQRTQNPSKTLKKTTFQAKGRKFTLILIFVLFCFVLEQRKSEEGDFRFGPREKWNESENMKEVVGEGRVRVNATQATYQIGTLRSEVGDDSKTVAEKVNSRYFNLHRDYSKSLTLSNVGEPS